ncbi:MAG: hypothetical protein EHM24_15185 [Acidobacteria bacterium]|nr:MAG: hypothetical protein EHM24_15185 [Acidobacteriota bacterium]
MLGTIRRLAAGCAAALLFAAGVAAGGGAARQDEGKRPQLTLRANPKISFVPAKVQFIAVLEGGADDYKDFYCPTIEWDWDDDTTSESSPDCEPYQPGSSRIRRRYTAQHVFNFDGNYEVKFRMKSGGRTIASVTIAVEVRPGH